MSQEAWALGEHAPDDQGSFEAPCLVCGERWPCESYRRLMEYAEAGMAWDAVIGSLPAGWQMAAYRRTDGTYTAVAKRFGGGRKPGWGTTINGATGTGKLVDALYALRAGVMQWRHDATKALHHPYQEEE